MAVRIQGRLAPAESGFPAIPGARVQENEHCVGLGNLLVFLCGFRDGVGRALTRGSDRHIARSSVIRLVSGEPSPRPDPAAVEQ